MLILSHFYKVGILNCETRVREFKEDILKTDVKGTILKREQINRDESENDNMTSSLEAFGITYSDSVNKYALGDPCNLD